MRKFIGFLLMSVLGLSISSCEETNNLGSMQFKFTGVRDTLVYLGNETTLVLTIYYLGGETEDVSLSVIGQGNGTNISFSKSSLAAGESSQMVISSVATADTGYFPLVLSGTTEMGALINREFTLHVTRPINTPPKIILTGAPYFYVTLNAPYTDPGFTAGDEEDGNITSQVVVTGSVNVDSVGIYIINYSVTDSEGLTDNVVRNVNVRNSLNYLNGQHNVITTNLSTGATRNWITTVSASVSINNQLKIFKISDCFMADPTLIYDPIKDTLFLPSQTFTCITPIDTVPHTFVGKGKIINGSIKRIVLDYTDSYIDTLGNPVMLNLRDEYQLF